MKRVIFGIAVFAALVWSAWLIAIPTRSVEKAIVHDLAAAGIRTYVEGFRKGAFMNFKADAIGVEVPGGGVLTVRDVVVSVSPMSIIGMKAVVPFSGKLGEGTVKGTAKVGSMDYGADVVLTGVQIEKLDILKNYKVNARGVLDADIHTERKSGNVEFKVKDLAVELRPPADRLAAMFNSAQGAFNFSGNTVNIVSASLKGESAYARSKGTITNGKADMQIEFMPEDDSALEPSVLEFIKPYMVSPGNYLIPVKEDIAGLAGRGA